MGKETKIGLGVIAVLLVVFAVVLALRLRGSSGETVAATDTQESAAEAKEKDTEKVKASPASKLKPLAPPETSKQKTASSKTKSSTRLIIPMPPVPDQDTKTSGPSQWKMVGGGPRQPPAPVPSSASSRYSSGGLVLDPPSAQQQNQFGSNRYTQRQPSGSSQTSRYQSPYGRSNYKNVSTGGTSAYGRGDYQQRYGKQRDYVPRQSCNGHSTYADQHAVTPSQIAPSPITPSQITPSQITPSPIAPSPITPTVAPRGDGTYEVQPNDSYWLISKQLYGSGSYFKALAEHNLREHPAADKLRVGDQIHAPSLEKLVDSFPDLCPSPRRQKTLAKRSSVIPVSAQYGGGSSYTVAEGDTLYDIARYELGDASRWVEIHELNRNTLQGDFDYLVPGMKLVMPRGSSAGQTLSPRQYPMPQGATDTLTRRPTRYQSPSRNTLRR